jgi:radical SAM-linked protein
MRARITFTKTGALKYIGHLDLQTLWERTARRAGLPLAYSHGFHPQARISFASALPLGFSSQAEVMDIRLQSEVDLQQLPERLQQALPAGITVLDVQSVDETEPALQMQVRSTEYVVALLEVVEEAGLQQKIEEVMAAKELPRERRGKPYDLRPLIDELRLMDQPGRIFMRLAAREAATGRPEEVLDELGIAARDTRVERTRLIFQQ